MATPRKLPNGRFQARYTITEGGVTRQVSAGTFSKKREAQDAIDTALVKRRAGEWVDPRHRKLTVEEWAEQWYELRRAPSPTVASFLKARIIPRWGSVRLEAVTTLEVQRWVNDLAAEGLSPVTVRDMYATFRQILGRAVDFDLLLKNPCRNIELPRIGERHTVVLTVEQIEALEAAAPPRFAPMIHLAAWCGLRWGECAALQWDCLDLEAGIIHVRRAMKVDGTIGSPKNGKSRSVPIGPATILLLRQHRRDFGNADLLFTTARGGAPLRGNNFRAGTWKKITDTAGLDPAPGFHALRHAHAGHMVMAGMGWQELADRLGHHKPSFTVDRYGWLRPDNHEVTRALLDKAMGGDR